ncbi:zinc metalloproteinase nas-15 [Aplysia californica]|uniref:Metalloendopeptidase n=1 Tax=Aplysia californica TaxID=6500 RepID=A0ABM0JYS5_APLCA|nr:zinc metalloproteinase nas-15 [Aplysia californica]
MKSSFFQISELLLLTAVLSTHAQSGPQPMAPPANMGRPFESATNLTMDEMITGALGGVDVASNMILSDGSQILAELDMYLTEEQFVSMYQPPEPEDMKKMGMYPAPLGSPPQDDDSRYIYEHSEARHGLRSKRKATANTRLRWTKAEMPYLFAKGHFDSKEEYMMRRSMTEWERYTCMKFYPATSSHKNSVRFQNGVGCNSRLGMVGGIQVLNLQAPGCRYKGLYLHEIGHAMGLVHEHQLPDRDNYIEILYHNVSPHMRIWFNKYTAKEVNQMNVPYEYSSVMHYGITAFSYDGKAQTIRAKDHSKEKTIGKVYLKELSYTDVEIVNKMYNCAGQCPDQSKCGPGGHLNENCDCICRDGSSDCDRTRQADRACRNIYDSWTCYIWANQGECDRNPFYMNQQCAKACGQCGAGKPKKQHDPMTWTWQWLPMFVDMFPQDWMTSDCQDVYATEKCQVWKERGDCLTNKFWMKNNCPVTCKLCTDGVTQPEENCENKHTEKTDCEDWAKDGECIVNRNWMFDNCRKSCHFCLDTRKPDNGTDGGTDEDDMKCVDSNHNCQSWYNTGQCTSNPNWMIPNCRKACKKCDDGTCKNFFDDKQCEIWAQKLECISNSVWMAKHCAKSCGRGLCEGVNPDASTTAPTHTTRGIGSTSRPRPTTTTRVTPTNCRNRHNSDTECDVWAKNDHCNINPSWMKKNCAKACGACDTGSGGGGGTRTTVGPTTTDKTGVVVNMCEDAEENCRYWARDGYCDKNPNYNLIYCKKSCNNCNGCRDAEFLCGLWAKSGHCEKNPRYMLRHCQKSCKACYMYKT